METSQRLLLPSVAFDSSQVEGSSAQSPHAAATHMTWYVTEAAEATGTLDALDFWAARQSTCGTITPLAKDLLAAPTPTSQAFVERIFFTVWVVVSWETQQDGQVVGNASLSKTE